MDKLDVVRRTGNNRLVAVTEGKPDVRSVDKNPAVRHVRDNDGRLPRRDNPPF